MRSETDRRAGDPPTQDLPSPPATGVRLTWSAAPEPPPPGLPTLRAFQGARGAAALAWLRHRTGWE